MEIIHYDLETNNEKNKIFNVFRRSNHSGYIFIPYEVMLEAYERKNVNVIAVSDGDAKVGGRGNIYFKYMNTNYVLMHIGNNRYKIINRYIETVVGKMDLVKELSDSCCFYMGRGGHVFCNPRKGLGLHVKTISLARVISSLEKTGYIEDIDNDMDCHHKVAREIETQNAIVLVERKDHKIFHSLHSNNSRQNNWNWDSLTQLVAGMKMVEFKDKQAALSPM